MFTSYSNLHVKFLRLKDFYMINSQQEGITHHTDGGKTKLTSLSRMFLIKAAECIYENRSPESLTDLEKDNPLFSLQIRKSNQLRSILSSKHFFGWFKLDIILANPDIVIERWHLIQLPIHPDAKMQTNYNQNELKIQTYRIMCQNMRSLYSMLNTLPAKTLQLQLSQLPMNNLKIKAVCDPFQKLPAQNEEFTELETARLRFGPITTPVGRTVIFLNHRISLEEEIPRPIISTQHWYVPMELPSTQNSLLQLNEPTPSCSLMNENSLANGASAVNFSNTPAFNSMNHDDFIAKNSPIAETPPSPTPTPPPDIIPMSIDDFVRLVQENMNDGFEDSVSLDDIKTRFTEVKNILLL